MQSKFIIYIIIGILVLAGVAGASWYFVTKQPAEVSPPEVSAPSPQPSPEEAPVDETADWKTYESSKMGFSMKYPTDWKIPKENPIAQEDFKGFDVTFKNEAQSCLVFVDSGKSYSEEKKELTFEQAVAEARKGYTLQYKNLKEEKMTLGGISAVKFSFYADPYELRSETRFEIIFTSWKNDLFYISFIKDLSAVAQCELIFNQMFSTFKFLE